MIALHDADQTNYPNLALMKMSAAFKAQGKSAELWRPEGVYEKVISSKVFSFTPETAPAGAILGGVGRGLKTQLPSAVEHICPDYTLYGLDYSLGFLTRGCPNTCAWCGVPENEGAIRAHADVEEFLRLDSVVLMDNNPLAIDHGLQQIEKLGRLGVKVDFNQGLDARRIDAAVARRLKKLKWLTPLRLACDNWAAMQPLFKAVEQLRYHNVTPSRYFCYLLVKDVDEALERVKFLKTLNVDPYAQPYRDREGTPPTEEQLWFARWVNMKAEYKSRTWEEYLAYKIENKK